MEWITKCSIGAAALAAVFAVQQDANAQTRSSLITQGVGSANAQRVGKASTVGVYVAPGAGVNEEAKVVGSYGEEFVESEWVPQGSDAPAILSIEDEKARAEALLEDSKAKSEQRRRAASRPIEVPATLGMLKDKPARRANPAAVPAKTTISPQYLQYAPNTDENGVQTSQSNYLQQSQSLNWDGSTNRGKEFGRVQAPTTTPVQPQIVDASTQNLDPAALVNLTDDDAVPVASFPGAVGELEDAGEALLPAIPAEAEPESDFGQSVLDELRGGAIPEDEPLMPAMSNAVLEDAPDALMEESDQPTFVAPSFGDYEVPEVADPTPLDVPDFNALDAEAAGEPTLLPAQQIPTTPADPAALELTDPEPVAPTTPDYSAIAPTPTSIPEIPAAVEEEPVALEPAVEEIEEPAMPESVAPTTGILEEDMTDDADVMESEAPSPAAVDTADEAEPAAAPAAPAAPANPTPVAPATKPANAVPAPAVYPQGYAPGMMAPRQRYISVAPNMGAQSYAPAYVQAAPAVPRTTGVPRQYGIPEYQGAGRRGMVVSPGAYMQDGTYAGAYGTGMDMTSSAPAAQAGLIFGAEWLYWKTDSDKSYALISGANGEQSGKDLKIEADGLRGRVGFRTLAGWDLIGTYTMFSNSDFGYYDSTMAPTGASLTNLRVGKDVELDSIDSYLSTDLQVIDIEMGRWVNAGAFDVRIFGGVRWTGLEEGVWDSYGYKYASSNATGSDLLGGEIAILDSAAIFDDDVEADSAMLAGTADTTTTTTVTDIAYDDLATVSRLNAYGVRLGLETRIPLAGALGFYGKGAAALAAGRVKSTTYDWDWVAQDEFKKTYLTPSVDASLGLSLKLNRLEARAGYEFNGWYNSGYVAGKKTDFLAHGFVAGLGYNY